MTLTEEQFDVILDYINLLEICTDIYYSVEASEEAERFQALLKEIKKDDTDA